MDLESVTDSQVLLSGCGSMYDISNFKSVIVQIHGRSRPLLQVGQPLLEVGL